MEALANALERRREHYNALFAEAQKRQLALDAEDFLDHLQRRVAPIMAALPEPSVEAEDRVLDALYRASLELLGRQLCGRHAPFPFVNAVWETLLPAVAPVLAVAPRRVVAAVSNAAFNLASQPAARPAEWIDRVTAVAAQCADVETLAAAGQIAAWRSGMAHFRAGALALCERVPEPIVRALLGVPASAPSDWLALLGQNRFATPAVEVAARPSGIVEVARLGGFRGFGGVFLAPPTLRRTEERLFACDRETTWEIHADAFGALLQRAELPKDAEQRPKVRRNAALVSGEFRVSAEGDVHWRDLSARLPRLARASQACAQGDLLAMTLAESHYVYLVAVTGSASC